MRLLDEGHPARHTCGMTGPNVPSDLLGGMRHPDARDLTRYLVHITSSVENLVNILTMGKIEARSPFGIARNPFSLEPTQHSACFAEIPANELSRLTRRGRYGVGFPVEVIRGKGGQRVWYLDDGSDPLQAVQAQCDVAVAARSWSAPVWRVTPFVDRVIQGQYDFVWEREWRLPGGLDFAWSDIAFIIAPEGDDLRVTPDPSMGSPWIDPDDWSVSWLGSSLEALDANIDGLLEKFHAAFITPDDASFPYSSADGGWQWLVASVPYDEAIDELFEPLGEHVKSALGEVIVSEGWYWARRYDVEHIAD